MIDPTEGLLGLGVVAGAALTFWQSMQARREAARAASNAHPVSNGWGTKVAEDLSYLREGMDRAHRRLDAMDQRQTAADQRAAGMDSRVSEAASHARTAAEQSAAVATGLQAHLADHARDDTKDVHLEVVTK